jgi:hypothetical protein
MRKANKYSWLCVAIIWGSLLLTGSTVADTAQPSPENQVFQFMQSGTCTAWSDGSTNTAIAYLWIPESCKRVRGLLILCANVPEHRLVGHSAIRAVCTSNDLGIVWCTPSFMNFARQKPGQKKMAEEYATIAGFLQQLLDGLAKSSGYEEVATAPWLPMGESGHLLMVDALVEAMPQRCLAGIWIKNSHLPPKNRQVPALVAYGTAQEWGQDKSDIRTGWNNIGKNYDGILDQRRKHPDWPFSYIIDGHSGHFDCSEQLTRYFARYINLVAKARCSDDGSSVLKPVKIESGFFADLPVPGHEGQAIRPANTHAALPWYFDHASAVAAQAFAAINWKAETQFPAFVDDRGNVLPCAFNGIADLNLKTMTMESDGITFTVRGTLLDRIPEGFACAGEKLGKAFGAPELEWLCGPVAPLGHGRLRIALDRSWLNGGTTYVALRQAGTDTLRGVVQPMRIDLRQMGNREGQSQKIIFEKINDVKVGSGDLPLVARSDASLPVAFFVIAGPAVVKDGKLVFTPIPPRTRFPVEVTVGAWQWGRSFDPKVKTADIIKQTFMIQVR